MTILSWYKLDGDATDSWGDNDGTVNGTVTYPDAIIEEGMHVTGQANNNIYTSFTSPFTTQTSFSIACWMRIPSSYTWPTGANHGVVAAGGYDGSHGIIRYLNVDNRISMYIRTTGGEVNAYTSITRDVWAHIVGVYDAVDEELRIYHDGVLIDTSSTSAFPNEALDASNFTLGGGNTLGGTGGANRYFEGDIDDVRFYDHALSLKEVFKLSQAKMGHWKLDGDGTDSSMFEHDGVITGGSFNTDSSIGSESWYSNSTDTFVTDAYPNSQNVTYSFWFKSDAGTSSHAVLGHRNGWQGWMFYRNSGNTTMQYHNLKYFRNTTPADASWLVSKTYVVDTWYHVVAAYDEDGNYKIFYDGIKTHYGTATDFDYWLDSSVTFTLGESGGAGGYNDYDGFADNVQIFNTYLSDEECIALHEERASLDNVGNLHVQKLQVNGIGEDTTNLFRYEKWVPGVYTTSQTFNGGLPNSDMHINYATDYTNTIDVFTNPNGYSDIMLETEVDTTHFLLYRHVGLYYDCNIDSTKTYRFTQWVYLHHVPATSYYIRHYIGMQGNTVCNVNTTTLNPNPYMSYPYINDSNFLDKWILQVYYIFPYGSTGNSGDANRIYETDGSNVSYGIEFNWADVSATHVRQLVMYQTSAVGGDINVGNYVKTYRPRFEIVDGSEPSIEELLANGPHLPLLDNNDNFIDTHSLSKEGIHYMRGGSEVGVTDGLVAWYPMNGDADDAIGTNDGVVTDATIVTGNKDLAYNFDGTTHIITVDDDPALEPSTDLTVSFWFKMDSWTAARQILCVKWFGYSCEIGTDQKMYFRIYLAGDSPKTTDIVSTGEWHHFVGTYNVTTGVSMYLDNVDYGTTAPGGTISYDTNPLKIGLYSTTLRLLGDMRDVRIYDRVLSVEEIGILYATTGGTTTRMTKTQNIVAVKNEFNEV